MRVFCLLPCRSLVDEVTGSIGAAEVMQSINVMRAATVTIDPVADHGGMAYHQQQQQQHSVEEGVVGAGHARGGAAGEVLGKRVRFEDDARGVYRREEGLKVAED